MCFLKRGWVLHRNIVFDIVQQVGEGLDEPRKDKIRPGMCYETCSRIPLPHCRIAIEKEQLVVWPGGIRDTSLLLKCPVSFTGVMLLGAEKDPHFFGFQWPEGWRYRIVREVRFDEGSMIEDLDRSQEVADLRAQYSEDPGLLLEALRRCS